jgi:sulfide:quinone oxidoreductase
VAYTDGAGGLPRQDVTTNVERGANTTTEGGRRFRVVIAGGGVAALEAMLALRELAADRFEITLVAPEEEFSYRPLSVVEPFAAARPRSFSLREIAFENDVHLRPSELTRIDELRRQVTLGDGSVLDYDALLLAIGARAVEAVPGAITFRGSIDAEPLRELIAEIDRGEARRVTFAIPDATWWPVAAYELALLTSAHAREHGAEVELRLVTGEKSPLALFGDRASAAVASLLADAGVEVELSSTPVAFADGRLELAGGTAIESDRAVALPIPQVPPIPGLRSQQHRGLIATDRFGGVLGMERIFAAGDATWFPVKQGGLAAQQADAAATAIAALAGAGVDPQPFRPVLRGAVLTGGGPMYLRADPVGGGDSSAAPSSLWWPPSKVAGRLLAPYLAAKAGYRQTGEHGLDDLAAPVGEDPGHAPEHEDVLALAFASADADAEAEDYGGAMRWLEVAEDLALYLPTEYELKRISWQELAKPSRPG